MPRSASARIRAAESTDPAAITGSEVAPTDRVDELVDVAVVAVGEQVDALDAELLGASARPRRSRSIVPAQQARVADDLADVGKEADRRSRR